MLVTTDIPLADGSCTLMQGYIDKTRADRLFASLRQNLAWTQPEVFLFGRKMLSPRLAAWYGDAGAVYKYSGLVNKPMPWTPELSEIRQQLVASCGSDFNSVLANLYRNGHDAMGWHSDDEAELGVQPVIASISLGASRRFLLRHKTDRWQKTVRLELNHGALLLMRDDTQRNWKHAVPRTRRNVGERINLTFRYIYPDRCSSAKGARSA